jgi:hypothetical protein
VKPYTDIEIERAKVLKVAIAAIRLKHSLRADEEIKRKVPDLEKSFNQAVQAGKVFELDSDSLLKEDE